MAYNSSTKTITAPVSIKDVQQCLGVSDTDLGTLCKKSVINKWSKMKPIAFPYIEPNRNAQVVAYGKTLWWWKGHFVVSEVAAGLVIGNYTTVSKSAWITSCGVKFLGFSNKADVLGAFSPASNTYDGHNKSHVLAGNYVYVPPQGGSGEPYRLVDFNYYKHDCNYNVIPDYGTEGGSSRINAKNPESAKVRFSVSSQAVSDTQDKISELSFDDLFNVGDAHSFTIVCGKMNGSGLLLVNLSTSQITNTPYLKEVEVNFNDGQVWNSPVFAFYCAYILVGETGYYVPLMQSNMYNENTYIATAPKRRVFRYFYIDNNTPFYPMSFTQKQNYGSSFAWNTVASMTSFQTNGVMNRWYLKIVLPKNSSGYSVNNSMFKIEFVGEFNNGSGVRQRVYYPVVSTDTRFVLKNNEVTNNYDWGSTETVSVPANTNKECYLAIYTVFANRHSVDTTHGGTVWCVNMYLKKSGQQEFPVEPDVVYGDAGGGTGKLNIVVDPVT